MCWPWAVKYFCHMRNMQGKHSKAGVDLESAYFRRYGTEYDGLRVPFGALVEFLPTSKFVKDETGAMSPKTVPGIFIGYYENSHSITKDYIVISLAYLYDAKMQPNDRDSWRLTPQRVGRIFFRQDQIRFPLKAAYDVRRESILQCDVPSGPLPSVLWGESPENLGDSVLPGEPSSSRGEIVQENKAEFSPEVLAEFPDDMTFPLSDTEVYGVYMPVRKGSMRVPDIQEGPEWNDLTPSHKKIQINLYTERCEFRRKDKIARLRKLLAQRLDKGQAATLLFSCYAGTRTVVHTGPEDGNFDEGVAAQPSPEETLVPRGEKQDIPIITQTACAQWEPAIVPAMPMCIAPSIAEHRNRIPDFENGPFNMLVAEPVSKTQRKAIPAAQKACDTEWLKLMKRMTWDPSTVQGWRFISSAFKRTGVKVHVAIFVFDLRCKRSRARRRRSGKEV